MGLKMVTGIRYLGGFIEGSEVEKSWLARKVAGWAESVETIAGVSRNHLQSAYSGLQRSVQQEWAFMQRVTPGIGSTFCLLEKALQETLFLALFEGLGEGATDRGVTCLPVKKA